MATQISLKEAVELAAVDGDFFGMFFFPNACRQAPPDFHVELNDALDSETDEFVGAMIARGFGKTTKLRIYIARRIAYRISRTIVVVGKSQEAAMKTLEWVMRAVQHNELFAKTFALEKGKRWTASDLEIKCCVYDENGKEIPSKTIFIRVIAVGITGSIRGINIDDFRPDLIVVDDPCDEENTATPEQRKKMSDLFFGALAKTLAPKVDSPFAKMVLLQTVLNREDLISTCAKDPQWKVLVFSCFTKNSQGEEVSRWEDRFPTEKLLADKQAHVTRNQLPLWLREMECKVVSEETAAFSESWLKYWDVLPQGGRRCLAIDPTPPPAQGKQSLNPKLDDAVIMAMQTFRGQMYVLEYVTFKSPDPVEFITAVFTMARKWKIKLAGFETTLFQRILAYMFRQEMRKEKFWLVTQEVEDRRPKPVRIQQEVAPIAQAGDLYIRPEHSKLIQQFLEFPDVNHDDVIDALSIGIITLAKYSVIEEDYIEGEYSIQDPDDPDGRLEWVRGAP
jgi:hypothetical protein